LYHPFTFVYLRSRSAPVEVKLCGAGLRCQFFSGAIEAAFDRWPWSKDETLLHPDRLDDMQAVDLIDKLMISLVPVEPLPKFRSVILEVSELRNSSPFAAVAL
jgi:hypothetical protein